MERVIRRRKESPELGWGTSTLVETPDPALFAHRCDWQGSTVVAVHNLGTGTARATLELGPEAVAVVDLLGQADHRVRRGGVLDVELGPYGYRWLRVLREGQRALA
jgi:maltose alpha-D-glucosyltransferase/alpha-amylase